MQFIELVIDVLSLDTSWIIIVNDYAMETMLLRKCARIESPFIVTNLWTSHFWLELQSHFQNKGRLSLELDVTDMRWMLLRSVPSSGM
jgi:serine kinase of HPr protein (carbohydrate metabolism regulator)